VKSMRTPIAGLVAFAALALAACGGSTNSSSSTGGGTLPETASFAPASVAYFVSVDTDTNGDQWKKAVTLIDRFPAHGKLLDELESSLTKENVSWENDVKPALGPEVGFAGLAANENAFVAFTKSPQPDKLAALVKHGDDPGVTKEVDGWTLIADTTAALDRFSAARSNGTLADSSAFKDAVDGVDADGIALAYVPGKTITGTIGEGLKSQGAPSGLGGVGAVESLAASVTAEGTGARFDVTATGAGLSTGEAFDPTLDETFPAKPLLFVDAAHLDQPLRKLLDTVQKSVPNFSQQRTQIEQALGLTLEGDVLPLFKGQIGLGVYGEASSDEIPVTIDAVLTVEDEAKATHLMDRLGALVQLGGNGTTAKVQVGDVQATELRISGEYSVFWVVDDGKLWISTSKNGLEQLRKSSGRLSDDQAYKSEIDAADVPGEVTSLVYADLQTAVPFVQSFAQLDVETLANLKPLRSIVASSTQDGDTTHVGGFVGIG
jgi:hypothetical protein